MSCLRVRTFSNARRPSLWFVRVVLCLLCLTGIVGCAAARANLSPTAAGIKPTELVDPTALGLDGPPTPGLKHLLVMGERIREMQRPAVIPPKRTVLVLSGGGSYGAYAAGILCGWTETGRRPRFDVVTGVSTGALISVFAFLGSEYDNELRQLYTTLHSADLYRPKSPIRALLSDSLMDTRPLFQRIQAAITPDVIDRIANGHREGRRLYIGTTDIEGRRPVVWDIGAIAASCQTDRRDLVCKLLLASAAIPVLFPAVEIPVDVDRTTFIERHVDGGVTQPLFFRWPYVPPEQRLSSLSEQFYGSDEYVIVAGKLFADPEPVKPQLLSIAGSSLATFTYAQTRDTLVKLYTQSLLTGMNYNLASIPIDFNAPAASTDFDPAQMSNLFEEGRRQIHDGTVWRNTPPGVGNGEELIQRAGTTLTYVPQSQRRHDSGSSPSVPTGIFASHTLFPGRR